MKKKSGTGAAKKYADSQALTTIILRKFIKNTLFNDR